MTRTPPFNLQIMSMVCLFFSVCHDSLDVFRLFVVVVLDFLHFVVPMGIFPWEIWVAFPKEIQLQQSNPECIVGLFVFPSSTEL